MLNFHLAIFHVRPKNKKNNEIIDKKHPALKKLPFSCTLAQERTTPAPLTPVAGEQKQESGGGLTACGTIYCVQGRPTYSLQTYSLQPIDLLPTG